MTARANELQARAERLSKPAYLDAAAAAQRLARRLASGDGSFDYNIAPADVFDPAQLRRALNGRRPNVGLFGHAVGVRLAG